GEGGLDHGHLHHVDQEIGGEVARGGDHLVRELLDGHGAAQVAEQLGVSFAVDLEHEDLPAHDAPELVPYVDRRVEGQLLPGHLPVHGEQDGELHGRGGVEG